VSPQVQSDHAVILGKVRENARLDPIAFNVICVTVNEHHWFAGALIDIMNANTVRVERLALGERVSREERDAQEQPGQQEEAHTVLSFFVSENAEHDRKTLSRNVVTNAASDNAPE
jgi:hypothetical protein